MKKILTSVGALLLFITLTAQPVRETSPTSITNLIQRLMAGKNFYLPVVSSAPTTRPSLTAGKGVDSVGAMVYNSGDTSVYVYAGADQWHRYPAVEWLLSIFYTKHQVDSIIIAEAPRITHDVTVYLGNNKTVGRYTNGQTIPSTGWSITQFVDSISQEVVHPTYAYPTASINPGTAYYERGSQVTTVMSVAYTQNDGGQVSGITYYANGSQLGINSFTVTSLTSTQSYYAAVQYTQGACKLNNLSQTDCTGQILAGTINTNTNYVIPFDKRYWGFLDVNNPTSAQILTLTQDNNGSTGTITLTNITPNATSNGGNGQYFEYFTKGSVSSVTVNNLPSTKAFTITTYSVTNAQGFTSTYTYVRSNNLLNQPISSIVIQ